MGDPICTDCIHVNVCEAFKQVEDILLSTSHLPDAKRPRVLIALANVCDEYEWDSCKAKRTRGA